MHMTQRESEVLSWIAQGKSDWQIGKILNISSKTVNYHAENAKRKLGVATRIQAVIGAIRIGAVAKLECELRVCVRTTDFPKRDTDVDTSPCCSADRRCIGAASGVSSQLA